MKKFFKFPKKIISLMLVALMVMTIMPSQGWLLIASAQEDIKAQILSESEANKEPPLNEPEELLNTDTESIVPPPAAGTPADGAVAGEAEEKETLPQPAPIFTLTINYIYGESAGNLSGSIVEQPYIATLTQGEAYNVSSPVIAGFEASVANVTGNLTENTTVNVLYNTNTAVKYTVNHIFQSLSGNEADNVVEPEEHSGTAGALTNAAARSVEGFTAGAVTQAAIAPGGETVIDIKYVRNEYQVLFNTNGGSYVDTQIKKFGETVSLDSIAEPKMAGYIFEKWCTDAGLASDAQLSFTMPANDVTLFAKWKDDSAKYTAVIWLEQADANSSGSYDYDFGISQELSAPVKSKITAADAYASAIAKNAGAISDIYEYDTAAAGNNQAIESLSGSGKEVINVYLKRKTVNVTFFAMLKKPNYALECGMASSFGTHNADGTHTFIVDNPPHFYVNPDPCKKNEAGVWIRPTYDLAAQWTEYIKVTGRIGERFGVQTAGQTWPETVNGKAVQWLNGAPDPGFGFQKIYFAKMERMPLKDTDCYAEETDSSYRQFRLNYYLEMLAEDLSSADKTVNGKRYKLHTYNTDFFSTALKVTVEEDAIEIADFKFSGNYDDYPSPLDNPEGILHAYLYYNREQSTISFSAPGADTGTVPQNITAQFGKKITAPTVTPLRTGYTFKGWNTDPSGNGKMFDFNSNTTMPAGGAALYAVWTPLIYDVTLDLNYIGAPKTEVQKIEYQNLASAPQVPLRDGYNFVGWFTAADSTANRYVFDKPVSSSFTIYAHWAEKTVASYTVKHVNNSGAVLDTETFSNVLVGTTVTAQAKSFSGYAPTITAKSHKITAGDNEIVLEYRPFVYLPYTIKYVEGSTGKTLAAAVTNDTNQNAIVTVNAKAIDGYTPDYLQKSLTLVVENGIIKNVITFSYTKNKPGYYIVQHYTADDSDQYVLTQTDEKQALAVGQKAVATPMAISSHTRNTSLGKAEGLITTAHRDELNPLVLTVYYDWKINDITYQPNNTVPGNEAFAQSVKYGKNTTAPENTFTAAERKVFLGWSENPDASVPTFKANEDILNVTSPKTLYAVWGNEAQYSLTYHANNGGEGKQTYDGGSHYADQSPAAAEFSATGFTAPTGKKFIGWSKTSNGTVDFYELSNIPMNGNVNLDLYSVWANKTENTVTYNGGIIDGSAGATVDGNTSFVEKRYEDDTTTVLANMFKNYGYKFDGWVDEQSNKVEAGTAVSAGTDLVLTASWVKDRYFWVKVIYHANGGINAPAAQEYKRNQLEAILAPKGEMSFGTNIFAGWVQVENAPDVPALIETKEQYDAIQGKFVTKVSLQDVQYSEYNFYAVWYADVNGPSGKDDGTSDALQFKALYDGNGHTQGTPPQDGNLYSETNNIVTKTTDIKRDKAVFLGWSTQQLAVITTQQEEDTVFASGNFVKAGNAYPMPNGGVTFYAVWAEDDAKGPDQIPDYKQFKITYLPGSPDAQGVTEDTAWYESGTITQLKVNGFKLKDYKFAGWKIGDTSAKENDRYTVLGDVEVVAQWKLDKNGPDGGPDDIFDEDEYSVTYNANGGTGDVPVNNNIYPEGFANVPVSFDAKPSKVGYDFLGWAKSNTATAPDFAEGGTTAFTMPKENVTLYAVYSVRGVAYNVKYVSTHINLNGIEIVKTLDNFNGTGSFGDTITLNTKAFVGYELTSPVSEQKNLGETADNNFVVSYKPAKIMLTAKFLDAADDSELADSQTTDGYYYGDEYSLNAKAVEGYTARQETLSGTINQTSGSQTVIFYYDKIEYKVTYKANNTVLNNDDKLVSVKHGESTKALAADTFKADIGKEFIGWSTDAAATAAEYSAEQTISNVTSNKTLYAVWGNKAQYTLTYHANNGGAGTQTYDGGSHFVDAAPLAVKLAETGFAAPEGKKFTGWSKTENGAVDYSENSLISMSDAANLDLYAVWVNKNTNTVTYNGGIIDGSAGATADNKTTLVESRYEDADGKVAENKFINDGYKFNGWVDAQNKSWTVGAAVSAGTDLVLTASWVKDDAQWGKLVYNANGGTNPPAEKEYKLSVGTVNLITGQGTTVNPATPNVIFGGWATERFNPVVTRAEYDAAMAKVVTSVTLKSGVNTVYAVWLVDVNGPTGNPDTTPDALQFKITYLAGSADATGVTEDTNLYSANHLATLLNNGFALKEHVFAGWSVNNETKQPGDEHKVIGETTVTALWKVDKNGPDGKPDTIPDEDEYSVLYYANGGTGSVPEDSNIYPVNYDAHVKFDVKPVKDGYLFLGWDTDSKAAAPTFTQGGTDTVKMAKNGVKLYAVYTASEVTYNIKYVSRRINSNGIEVEKTLKESLNLPGKFDQQLTLEAEAFTGYTLKGDAQQNVKLKMDGNDFVFYYEPNPAEVTSRYLEIGTENEILPEKNWGSSYQFGVTYSIDAAPIIGFTPAEKQITFKIDSDKHQVVFYYTRNQYAYEIRYETADGTALVVPTTGSAPYEANVTANPVTVDGYTPRSGELSMKIGTDTAKNVIIFIYDANPATVTPPVTPVEPPVGPVGPITPVTPPEVEVTPPAEIEIPDEETALEPGKVVPGPVEIIDDEETALVAAPAAWALLNLLLAILTALIMVLLFVWYFIGKKKDNDKEKNKQNAQTAQNANATENTQAAKEDKDSLKRKGWMRLLSIIPTVAAIVFFILTENMLNPMVWMDRWTIWMAVIALVQIVVALFCRKKREDNDKQDSDKNMPKTNLAQQNA